MQFVWEALAPESLHLIQTRRLDARTDELGPVTDVSPRGRQAFLPRLAVGVRGTVDFAWDFQPEAVDTAPSGGRVRRMETNGTLGAIDDLGDGTVVDDVAVDPAGTAFYLVERGEVAEVRSRTTGSPVTTAQQLGTNLRSLKLAVGPGGTVHVVYYTGVDTVGTRHLTGTGELSAPETVSRSSGYVSGPAVAVDPAGNAHFAWVDHLAGNVEVVKARSLHADGTFGPEETLSAPARIGGAQTVPEQPDLAAGLDGNVVAAWERFDGRQTRVQGAITQTCEDDGTGSGSDDDGDGLCDSWETDGIDVDGDGQTDLKLYDGNGDGTIAPNEQADPEHKDLYVEIDWMADHRPDIDAVRDVARAFARADVPNPDGTTGIRLHVQLNEEALDHSVPGVLMKACGSGPAVRDFDAVKAASFGTADERAPGAEKRLAAKRLVTRYGLFVHELANLPPSLAGSSGCGELPGDDFAVSLGDWTDGVGTRGEQAGTLMHELGHTLGLHHGGGDDENCKPNYLSVMSYSRQLPGAPIVGRRLDYSPEALPELDENQLDEFAGISGPFGDLTAYGDDQGIVAFVDRADVPIDWNRNGMLDAPLVKVDVDNIPGSGCASGSKAVLQGYDDWANIEYDFRGTAGFGNGGAASGPAEITYDQARAASGDRDGDGIEDFEDDCPTVADPDQADADGDDVGDACPPPGAPELTGTVPGSPGTDNAPRVRGSARPGTIVRLYTDRECTQARGAAGSAADFASPGLAVHVGDNSSTTFYADATDDAGTISDCAPAGVTYVEDSAPPAPPQLSGSAPASPANDNSPRLQGSAEAGSTVRVYPNAACSGAPVATGPASELGAPGLTVGVGDDTTTVFHATATDQAGNTSDCSAAAVAYVEDSTAPEPPGFAGSDPPSPSSATAFHLQGSAEPDSTVRVYTNAGCSGAPTAAGSEAEFETPGLRIVVDDNSTSDFFAEATDRAGNRSACTTGRFTYVHDSIAPATPAILGTDPSSPSRIDTPRVLGSAEPGATVLLYIDSACSTDAVAADDSERFASPGVELRVADEAETPIAARAVDRAGNASGCSGAVTYVHDSVAPEPPVFSGSDPQSPADDNGPRLKGRAEPGSTVLLFANETCAGAPAAGGAAEDFARAGIAVTVADNTSTVFSAQARDRAGNASDCSASPLRYVEASPVFTGPLVTPDLGGRGRAFGARTLVTLTLPAARLPASGRLRVTVANGNAFAVIGTLRGVAAGRTIGRRAFSVPAGARRTVALTLPASLRRRFAHTGRLTLRLTATVRDPTGDARTVTAVVSPKLKRTRSRR